MSLSVEKEDMVNGVCMPFLSNSYSFKKQSVAKENNASGCGGQQTNITTDNKLKRFT